MRESLRPSADLTARGGNNQPDASVQKFKSGTTLLLRGVNTQNINDFRSGLTYMLSAFDNVVDRLRKLEKI